MDRPQIKLGKICSTFILGLIFTGALFSSAQANTLYMRGPKVVHPHSVNRFRYTHPAYRNRKPNPVKKCKALGQARCLNPRPTAQPYLRHPNGVRTTDIHPYLRKVFKPHVKRYR